MKTASELRLELKIKKDEIKQVYLSISDEMIEAKMFLLGSVIAYEILIQKIDSDYSS